MQKILVPVLRGAADPGEPGGAALQDRRRDGDRLDIVDRRRAAVEPDRGRERRLQARLALLAFEAFEEPRLLAADVGAGAAVQVDFEVVAGAAGVLADEPRGIGLLDRRLKPLRLVVELAADIDVGGADPHPDAGQQTALDQLVRIVPQDVAVLAGAGLALVGIDDEIGRPVAGLRHERPFEPGREAGAAAAAQPRLLALVDDPVAALVDHLLGAVPIAASSRAGEMPIVLAVEIGEDAVAISQHFLFLRHRRAAAPPEAAVGCGGSIKRSYRGSASSRRARSPSPAAAVCPRAAHRAAPRSRRRRGPRRNRR